MASARVLSQIATRQQPGQFRSKPFPSTSYLTEPSPLNNALAQRPESGSLSVPNGGSRLLDFSSPLATRHSPLPSYFHALFSAHGPQHWWPGRTRFEIIVGAILTQNTSWTNVERGIANLRAAKLLSPKAIRDIPARNLATHLRPSGYFRQKSRTLKGFVTSLYQSYGGSLQRLFATPTPRLREKLLALRGIGPETADSILLYAGKHPVFVVDAYTRRLLERHHLARPKASYEEIRSLFESALPRDHQLFNEFHALIVHTGKHHCLKSNPNCSVCPLSDFLPEPGLSRITNHETQVTSHKSQVTSRDSLATRHSPLATSP